MSVVDVRLPVMTTSVLDQEMFSEAEASRLLRVPQSTLHWWLEGGTYRNREYRPVIRLEPRGERSVTLGRVRGVWPAAGVPTYTRRCALGAAHRDRPAA
jgi:hypothetical protein